MSFWSGTPPPLEAHFFEGGGINPPFFGSKITNLLVFLGFEPKKVSGSRLYTALPACGRQLRRRLLWGCRTPSLYVLAHAFVRRGGL